MQASPDRWAAENTPTGIFAASGPNIRPRGNIGEIDIVDIAPTLLANHGAPVPTDIDGEVLDVFTDEPSIETQQPIDHDSVVNEEEREEVADRLKQLGYME